MQCKDNKNYDADLLLRIFVETDDFCKLFEPWYASSPMVQNTADLPQVSTRKRRAPGLCASEVMTILIYYHHSGYKCFEYYYKALVVLSFKDSFPKLVSYNRFIELLPRAKYHLLMFGQWLAHQEERKGIFIIDSKKLPVCHNRRIAQNKTFEGFAARGKASTGWFYGLKIHLIINHLGGIVRFKLTPANVADNNVELLRELFDNLHGKVVGDLGYLTKFFQEFYEQGVQIITRLRSNMKNKLMDFKDKLLLKKRPIIEAVNDILMSVCDIEHTRHRSPINAICHIWASIVAYHYLPNKPAIILEKLTNIL